METLVLAQKLSNYMNKISTLVCGLVIVALFALPVFADTVSGNGYVLNQSVSTSTYEIEGNGYSATQTVAPIYGELEGQGYSSVTASPNDSIQAPPPQIRVPVLVSTPPPQSFSVSGGRVALLDSKTVIASAEIPDVVSKNSDANEALSNQLDKLVQPFLSSGKSQGLSGLYSKLGTVIKEQGQKGITAETVPAVINAVGKVFNSKSTFSLITMSVVVLLFMSLGVSVFGYKEIHKIISTVVCVGSLFGYYTASEIYLLPAIVGFIVLIIFLVQQKEREVLPRVT